MFSRSFIRFLKEIKDLVEVRNPRLWIVIDRDSWLLIVTHRLTLSTFSFSFGDGFSSLPPLNSEWSSGKAGTYNNIQKAVATDRPKRVNVQERNKASHSSHSVYFFALQSKVEQRPFWQLEWLHRKRRRQTLGFQTRAIFQSPPSFHSRKRPGCNMSRLTMTNTSVESMTIVPKSRNIREFNLNSSECRSSDWAWLKLHLAPAMMFWSWVTSIWISWATPTWS